MDDPVFDQREDLWRLRNAEGVVSPLKVLADAGIHPFYIAGYEAGMADERERCAKIADQWANRDTGRDIARAIRRGTP